MCCAHKGIVCFHEKSLHLFMKGGCVVVSRGVVYGEKRLDANKVGVPHLGMRLTRHRTNWHHANLNFIMQMMQLAEKFSQCKP